MKRLLLTTALLAALHAAALAVSMNVDAERLKDVLGAPMQVSGLVVLTAGTSGTFPGPTPSSFTSGDEIVLKKWDLSAFGTPGALQDTTGDLALSGAWDEGDPLQLYWYPTLGLNSPEPGFGTTFGTYRHATGLDGSAPWITPGAGDIIDLKFFTTDATFLSNGGSNPSSAGDARFIVVPEPGTALMSLVGFAVIALARRRPLILAPCGM